ncbi:MAG: hypothetical protein ACKV2V_06855, partial [Blastocatellia bacterium]
MALDERKRQKKLQRKKAARKKTQVIEQRQQQTSFINLLNDPTTMAIAGTASLVHECYVPKNLSETGMGVAMVSRLLPDGRIAAATFLLDTWCLGIKDADAKGMRKEAYPEYVRLVSQSGAMEKKEPSYVKKLITDLEAWSANLGFSPHPDYRVAKRLIEDLIGENCTETFTFGRNGRPHFVSGP